MAPKKTARTVLVAGQLGKIDVFSVVPSSNLTTFNLAQLRKRANLKKLPSCATISSVFHQSFHQCSFNMFLKFITQKTYHQNFSVVWSEYV